MGSLDRGEEKVKECRRPKCWIGAYMDVETSKNDTGIGVKRKTVGRSGLEVLRG